MFVRLSAKKSRSSQNRVGQSNRKSALSIETTGRVRHRALCRNQDGWSQSCSSHPGLAEDGLARVCQDHAFPAKKIGACFI
jgi:hypothetical protein